MQSDHSKNRIRDSYRLGPMQEGMLFHYLSAGDTGVDIEQIVCTLDEPLDLAAFRAAWAAVIARHPALRTSFRWDGLDEPIQQVNAQTEIPWDVAEWAPSDSNTERSRLEELLQQERHRGFRLDTPPLMRFIVRKISAEKWLFVWSFNHILLDGHRFL